MTTQAVDEEELLVHTWRVARLTQLGIPERWPRSKPTASTGTKSPGSSSTAAPRGWPCASSCDERTREVARTLNIAPKTAGNHIERIYTKIGASSRATATLFALQHGMLSTLEPVTTY